MTIFDGILILATLGCIVALGSLCYLLVRHRWMQARRVLLVLCSFLVLYAVVLLSVSLLSPQRVLVMHQDRCFDVWCLSVEQVVQQPTIGLAPKIVVSQGTLYLVTVRVSSHARRITQRALDALIYLLDARSQRVDPSPTGQQALDATGQGGQPLDSELVPGGSFSRTVVFDLPGLLFLTVSQTL